MRPNGKKTWNDLLVDEANLADTPAKRRLRELLWKIAKYKHDQMPKEIIDELERVKSMVTFVWPYPDSVTFLLFQQYNEFKKQLPQDDRIIPFAEWLIKKHGEIAESRAANLKAQGWDLRPRLFYFESLNEFDTYLWRLIPKLMDPDWVAALRICPGPGCKKLIMSSAKWKRKFCTETCKNRFWGRKNRTRDKEDPPEDSFECPGNGEGMTITKDSCINVNGVNVRGRFKYTCPTCPLYKKGGK